MREKMAKMMAGRYGSDQLNKALLIASLVAVVLHAMTKWSIFWFAALLLLIYSYYRMFSKNIAQRYAENQKYIAFISRFTKENRARRAEDKKTNRIFKCPACKQKVRVPKGRGKICITCPKCKKEFVKKS